VTKAVTSTPALDSRSVQTRPLFGRPVASPALDLVAERRARLAVWGGEVCRGAERRREARGRRGGALVIVRGRLACDLMA
jgi:hypothetical protein